MGDMSPSAPQLATGPAPQYQQPPLDPAFLQLMQATQQQSIDALQRSLGDQTRQLMQVYGTHAALTSTAPGAAPAPVSLAAPMPATLPTMNLFDAGGMFESMMR